jgi:hypothetical protein
MIGVWFVERLHCREDGHWLFAMGVAYFFLMGGSTMDAKDAWYFLGRVSSPTVKRGGR